MVNHYTRVDRYTTVKLLFASCMWNKAFPVRTRLEQTDACAVSHWTAEFLAECWGWCCRLLQVSTLSEMTRHTASVATDDESLDGLVIVDDIQTTQIPGILQWHCTDAITFHCCRTNSLFFFSQNFFKQHTCFHLPFCMLPVFVLFHS